MNGSRGSDAGKRSVTVDRDRGGERGIEEKKRGVEEKGRRGRRGRRRRKEEEEEIEERTIGGMAGTEWKGFFGCRVGGVRVRDF